MIKKALILTILLLFTYLAYILLLKKERQLTPKEIQKQSKPLKPLQTKQKTKKEVVIKKERKQSPKIDLKYYNLSLEKNYKQEYDKREKSSLENSFQKNFPPLNKVYIEPKSSIDFSVIPEVGFDKQTKEITIDGVQIQLEKKF